MKLLGGWGEPLSSESNARLIAECVKNSNATCQFCGFQSIITPSNPAGGLHVCARKAGMSVELNNVVSLCSVCVNFNSIDKLRNKGHFVELPMFTQSEVVSMLRTIYCAQMSTVPEIKNTLIYRGSNALLKSLNRIPDGWDAFNFMGSVERISDVIRNHNGYTEETVAKKVYIDRLRFFFTPEQFQNELKQWLPIVETQIINADS